METDYDSRSSSATSGSSNSTSNGPASPPQENESNDQPEPVIVPQRSRSTSRDSNSIQERAGQEESNPASIPEETNVSNENQSKEDEEELELSDIDDESNKPKKAEISHEDLSDISDLDSNSPSSNFTDLRQKLDKRRFNGSSANESHDKSNDEDELDFEADEVREVSDNPKKAPAEVKEVVEKPPKEEGEHKSEDEVESGEELEDGEVTDGDDKRPEESEPKAVCRFFTRGQCTWGMSCRFLHPGTTDKGNYTMFDMVRPIPVPQAAPIIPPAAYDYRNERPPIHHMPPHAAYGHPRIPPVAESESAWERGLRTAKEMMRKANKRKEQDIDFDEKKMNLSGPPDEIEKDPYYVRGSPEVSKITFQKRNFHFHLKSKTFTFQAYYCRVG
jgi:nuclear protein NHN1